jgi:hypothetical protein
MTAMSEHRRLRTAPLVADPEGILPSLARVSGSPQGTHARAVRLTRGQKRWLAVAVTFAIAGMLAGFWFSFWNLKTAAAAQGWHSPWLLPLMIDLGIPTYVIIDHLLVTLGCRSLLARLAVFGFAGLTIGLNGAFTHSTSLPWRIAAMAAPSVWVLGIEVLRVLWRALRKGPASRASAIPAGRWLANPVTALLTWRRKQLLGVTSWPLMNAIEDARVYLRDAVSAVRARRPDLPVPLSVRRAMRSGRFPGEVRAAIEEGLEDGGAAHWEPVTDAWLVRRLGLPEALSEAISNDRLGTPESTPREVIQDTPGETAEDAPEKTPRGTSRKPSRAQVKKMTAEQLAPHVRALLPARGSMTLKEVMAEFHVGEPKAREALRIARMPRPLHAVSE